MAAETLLQTFFTRLGFQVDTKGIDQYAKKLTGLSTSLLKLSGITSLSLTGLFAFTQQMTKPMAEIAKLSETYGIATDTIAAFNRMGRDVGITTDSMQQSIGRLSTAMGAVAGPAAAKLRKLVEGYGLSVDDASGKTKDMRTFLGEVADRMTKLSVQEQVNLVQKLGFDPSMVRLLRNGREEFEKVYDVAAKGLPFTAEDYAKAEKFQIAITKARAAVTQMTTAIAVELLPMFQRMMDGFLAWWKKNGETVMARIKFWVGLLAGWLDNALTFIARLTGSTDILTAAMKALGVALGYLAFAKLASWVDKAALAFTKLTGAQALATWQITLIAAGIALLIGIVLLAIDDFETWRKGGISVIGTLIDYFDKGGESMKKLRDIGKWVWDQLTSYWDWAKESWGAAFEQMKKTFGAWWPEIKDGLVLIGGLIVGAIVIVAALAIGFVILAAKVVEAVGKIVEWLALLKDKPQEALKQLSDWLQSILDKVGGWISAAIDKADKAVSDWIEGLWNKFAKWVWDGVDKVVAAFKGVFTSALNAVAEFFKDWWNNTILGRLTGLPDKVKSALGIATKAAEPAVKAAASYVGYQAPTFMAGSETAVPLTGEQRRAQLSQENVGNITQNNTFEVKSMDEAVDTANRLQQDMKRQSEQLSLAELVEVW